MVYDLPESVTDRPRRSHEQWFHFVRSPRYYAATDEIREEHIPESQEHVRKYTGRYVGNATVDGRGDSAGRSNFVGNPLGKLPGSVWTIPSEPLIVPQWAKDRYNLPDHFAAFPQEWPRRLILGWSPNGVCVECGEGRRPVVEKKNVPAVNRWGAEVQNKNVRMEALRSSTSALGPEVLQTEATITGYACGCQTPTAETRPAVVLDPFMGTGTVLGVAKILGRLAVGVDLSNDYCKLASWRIHQSGHFAKASGRTWKERQGGLL